MPEPEKTDAQRLRQCARSWRTQASTSELMLRAADALEGLSKARPQVPATLILKAEMALVTTEVSMGYHYSMLGDGGRRTTLKLVSVNYIGVAAPPLQTLTAELGGLVLRGHVGNHVRVTMEFFDPEKEVTRG